MADSSARRLLHLLTSADSAKAFEIAALQQQQSLGRPLLVLASEAARLTPPAGVETLLLVNEMGDTPGSGPSLKTIDYHALLQLIYESESVSVW